MSLLDYRPPITDADYQGGELTDDQVLDRMRNAPPEAILQAVGYNLPRTDVEIEMLITGFLIGKGEGWKLCAPDWFEDHLLAQRKRAIDRTAREARAKALEAFAQAASPPSTEQ